MARLPLCVALGLGAILLLFALLWKRQHLLSFGLIWFFLNIAPVLNSRWLGPNVFTERYLYLPSVGFLLDRSVVHSTGFGGKLASVRATA